MQIANIIVKGLTLYVPCGKVFIPIEVAGSCFKD